MNHDLYFIPIITKALQQKDTKIALKDAFKQIKTLGCKPEYQQGYKQFERFMDSVAGHVEKDEEIPDDFAAIEKLCQFPDNLTILISQDNKPFRTITFSDIPEVNTIDSIIPGNYSISLAGGRVIWEGEITAQDIVWAKARPKEPFKLAADTTSRKAKPAKAFNLFEGQIVIRLFAGLENGSMEIEMNKSKETE